jgi:hypothetical protein
MRILFHPHHSLSEWWIGEFILATGTLVACYRENGIPLYEGDPSVSRTPISEYAYRYECRKLGITLPNDPIPGDC